MRILTELDIFGEGINFTIMGKKKVQSLVGASFSLIMIVLCIFSILIFGKDFFEKCNPIVTYFTMIPEEYENPFTLDPKKIQFPFRMKDYKTSKTINFTGIMEPSGFVAKFKRVNGNMNLVEKIFIDSPICTDEIFPTEIKNKKPSDYYCPDFSKVNETLGGGFDGDYYHFYALAWRCSKNKLTIIDQPEECDYDALDKFISNSQITKGYVFHEILYPEYYVSQDYEKPLKIVYKALERQIDLNTQYADILNMQQIKFQDDLGWITSSYVDTATLSLDSRDINVGNINKDSIVRDKFSIYLFQITLNKKYTQFKRRYMKIQELIAQVGGILNGIHKLFLIVHLIFFRYIQKELIMNQIFSFKDPDIESAIKGIPKINIQKNQNHNESNLIKLNHISKSNVNILSEMVFQRGNLSTKIVTPLNNKKNLKFGFCVGLKETIFCKNNTTDILRNSYRKMNNYINQRIDVCYYLDHLKQFSILKTLILNPAQILCLKYSKKPEIFNIEEMERVNIDLAPDEKLNVEKIIKYYTEKAKDNNITETDSKLFNLLDTEIKNKI